MPTAVMPTVFVLLSGENGVNNAPSHLRDSISPDNVRAVVLAADPDLDHGHRHLLREEHVISHDRHEAEVRWHIRRIVLHTNHRHYSEPTMNAKHFKRDKPALPLMHRGFSRNTWRIIASKWAARLFGSVRLR